MRPEIVKMAADALLDFATKLQLIAGELAAGETDAPEATKPTAPKSKRPKAEADPPETESATAPPESETDPAPESEFTADDVREALGKKSQAGFTTKCKALIAKYGVKSVSELDPAHYAAIIAEAEAIK